MKTEMNFEKKFMFAILGFVLVIGGIFVVYAVVPNPGHLASSIDWSIPTGDLNLGGSRTNFIGFGGDGKHWLRVGNADDSKKFIGVDNAGTIYISQGTTVKTLNEYIQGVVNNMQTGDLTCSTTPFVDTLQGADFPSQVAYKYPTGYNWKATGDIPSACNTDEGCVIKQEIYKLIPAKQAVIKNNVIITPAMSASLGLVKVITSQYTQLGGNFWTSTYRNAGTDVNGDATAIDILPQYSSGTIRLADDVNTYGEKLSTQWSVRDASTVYGMKIYICTSS